jgi:hypothetical protein
MAMLSDEQRIEAGHLCQSGLSVQQVAEHFGVSLNATFYALRKLGVARRTAQESNAIRFDRKQLSYNLKSVLTDREEKLKLAAVMLYWAEGYKISRSTVDFANSDPSMVKIFVEFLRTICGIDENKLRCFIYAYDNQDIRKLKRFWMKTLHVRSTQFTKPYIKPALVTKRGHRMIHGLVHVRYCDKKLLKQILDWIGEYQAECVGTQVVNEVAL